MDTKRRHGSRIFIYSLLILATVWTLATVINASGLSLSDNKLFERKTRLELLEDKYRHWPERTPDVGRMQALAHDNNAFACDMYSRLVDGNAANLTYSPFSISVAMAMVNAGARGSTKSQIRDAMHYTMEDASLVKAFGDQSYRFDQVTDLYSFINEEGDIDGIYTANSVWIDSSVRLEPAYRDVIENGFNARIETLDFDNPARVAKEVNQWTAAQTLDQIPEVISPQDFSEYSLMVLVNCLTFDLSWQENWSYEIENEQFNFDEAAQVEVPMLHLTKECPAAITDTFTALNIPLCDDEMSLLMLLPHDVTGLREVESNLSADALSEINKHLSNTEAVMTFPEFEIHSDLRIKPVLEELGITQAFGQSADLTGIGTSDAGDLFIEDVIHKAFTEVNENGVGAAAATVVLACCYCAMDFYEVPEQVIFTADHPFLFIIQDNVTGAVLFMGRVMDPS